MVQTRNPQIIDGAGDYGGRIVASALTTMDLYDKSWLLYTMTQPLWSWSTHEVPKNEDIKSLFHATEVDVVVSCQHVALPPLIHHSKMCQWCKRLFPILVEYADAKPGAFRMKPHYASHPNKNDP